MARFDTWTQGWFDYRRKRFWALLAVVLYTLFGFVIAPLIVRSVIVDQVHEQLGLTATLDDVDINPYALSARLEQFALADQHGEPLLGFAELDVNVQLSSIVRRALTLSEFRIVQPFVNVVRDAHGSINLAALVPPASSAAPEPATTLFPLIVQRAELGGGRVKVVDRDARSPFQAELGPVDLKFANLSTLPDAEGNQTLVMQTRYGGRLDWVGTLRLSPLHSAGHIALTGERLADFSAYLPKDLLLSIVDGTLDVAFDYTLASRDGGVAADVSKLGLAVKNLGVAQRVDAAPAEQLLRFAELEAQGGRIEWPQQTVAFERVALTQPTVLLSRDAQQRFVWETLWQPAAIDGATTGATAATNVVPAEAGGVAIVSADSMPGASAAAASVPLDSPASAQTAPATGPAASAAAAAAPVDGNVSGSSASASGAPSEAPSPPWSVTVGRLEIADGHVGFDDRGVDPAAALGASALTASLDAFTLADGAAMPFAVKFNVDGGGAIALDGSVTLFPETHIDAQAHVDGLALNAANPYLRADTYVQIAGALGIDGRVVSNPDEPFGYNGTAQLTAFEVQREGVDERFAGLKRLTIKGVALSTAHRKVDIARAELDAAFAKIHITKDGKLNLANVIRAGEKGVRVPSASNGAVAPMAPSAEVTLTPLSPPRVRQAAEAPWAVKLARLNVTNADIDFTDETLPIPFHREISALTGGIDALDSVSRAPTQLKLVGQVGDYGELRVTGSLRALDPLQSTDITASFRNVEMPATSPYAITFTGHKIASGKLDLDLHYVVHDGMLNGQHKVVLHDFELGEKVDYPDALDLPYGLAISLLKDSSGNIDIELPVEGDVNDPKFRIGGVIMKALGNLITKIVTAPFSFLGRLVGFGGGDGFDQILFEPGAAELAPPEREKVAKIGEALVLRPNLALTLHGVVDPDADARALREAALRARLDARVGEADAEGRLRIVEAMARETAPGIPIDALRAQYSALPTVSGAAVLDQTAYVNALVEQMIAAEPLGADVLTSLAAARLDAVRAGLAANAALDAARVTSAEQRDAKLANGRVPMQLDVATH